jgi:hypothetical protein
LYEQLLISLLFIILFGSERILACVESNLCRLQGDAQTS